MKRSSSPSTKPASRVKLLGSCAALLLAPSLHAQSLVRWAGPVNNVTNEVWGTATNWTGSDIPDTSNEIADLRLDWTGTAPTIAPGGDYTVNGIFYDDTGSATDVSLTINAGNVFTLAGTAPSIRVDANTLTLASALAGATGWKKQNGGTLALLDNNTGLTGTTTISGSVYSATLGYGGSAGGGTLALGSTTVATGSLVNSTEVTIINGTLQLVNTAGNADRIGDTTPVTIGLGGVLLLTHNANANTTETIGAINLDRGGATVTVSSAASRITRLEATTLSRGTANATALIRGTSLTQTVATNVARIALGDGGASLTFVGGTTLSGAPTNDATKTVRIVPYLFGDSSSTGTGNGFVTYDTTLGLRVLTANQVTALTAAYVTPGVLENVSAPNITLTGAPITVNSLLFSSANGTLNSTNANPLTVASGAVGSSVATTALGSGFSSLVLGNGEGVFHVATSTLTINTPVDVTGGGGITKGAGGTLVLTGNNLYTGSTIVNAGTLTLSGLSNTPGKIIINGGQLNFNTASNIGGGASALGNPATADDGRIELGGTLLFNGATSASTDRSINLTASADGRFSSLNNSGTNTSSLTISGNITGTNSLLVRGAGGDITLSGLVSNTGDIDHTEARTLFLTNPGNSFTGALNVFAGIVSVPTVSDAGVNSAIGAGSLISVGQVGFPSNSGTFQYTGTSASTNRTIIVSNVGNIESATVGETLTLAGPITLGVGTTLPSPGLSLQGAGNGIVSGNISGALLRIVKNGAGTWTLSGSNSYTGTTTVTTGTLLVNGTISGSASVTVSSTATLGGIGTIAGPVTVNTGGFITPGTSIGALGTGALTMAAGSTFALEINTTTGTSDLLNVTGNLTLSDADDTLLTISDLSPQTVGPGVFPFITYSGAWDGDLFTYAGNIISDDATVAVGANTFTLDYNYGGNTVALIAVPEPASAVMLLSGLGMLIAHRRRRTR